MADTANANNQKNATPATGNSSQIDYLRSIDQTLKSLLQNSKNISQSNAQNMKPDKGEFQKRRDEAQSNKFNKSKSKSKSDNIPKDFKTAFLKGVTDSILGSGWQDSLKKGMKSLGDSLGVDLSNIKGQAGNYLGKAVTRAFSDTKTGKAVKSKASSFVKDKGQAFKDRFEKGRNSFLKDHGYNIPETDAKTEAVKKGGKPVNSENAKSNSEIDQKVKSNETAANNVDSVSADANKKPETDAKTEGSILNVDTINANSILVESEKDRKDLENNESSGKSKEYAETNIDPTNVLEGGNSLLKDVDGSSVSDALNAAETATDVGNIVSEGAEATEAGISAAKGAEAGAAMISGDAAVGATLSGLGEALGPILIAAPEILIVIGAVVAAFALLEWAIGPAIEGFGKLAEAAKTAANRDIESRKKMLEEQKKRLQADVEALVKIPFTILEDAAKDLYEAWDNQIQIINSTQGYTKSDLQDLMMSYSERIKSEGLSNEINVADVTENLGNVLKSGLSGQVAVDFAYLATKLNAAVPTQDFFEYASTYASLAANAIKNGKSQSEAIAYANEQLEQFTSNVLYASRELSGGFSTGLKDAQSLFEQSVQIAQASKTGDAAEISGVLTAVSSTVGAIAPDLASDMVSAVTKAATGGNSSDIVALRSLAGINASNTEFLRQFASDPQKIFSSLFSNLAQMQNMSPDAYMEVAEGLSSTFGISMDALARVDFQYLADAVSQMNVNNSSLEENMKLLKSGETTTTASQMRFAEINQQIMDEGMAYVLDSEYGRMVQEHMWDEQLANQLQESTYAVNLQGSALEFLEGIRETMDRIIGLLNPFSWGKKIVNLVNTAVESQANAADIARTLIAGKVGTGNTESLRNLITTGQDLELTHDYAYLRTGFSSREAVQSNIEGYDALANPYTNGIDSLKKAASSLLGVVDSVSHSTILSSKADSQYQWSTITKSAADNLFNNSSSNNVNNKITADMLLASTAWENERTQKSADENNSQRIKLAIEGLLSEEYISKLVQENGQSAYADWTEEVSTKLGSISKDISIDDALETLDTDVSQVKQMFANAETEEGGRQLEAKALKEEDFWNRSIDLCKKLLDDGRWLDITNDHLTNIQNNLESFLTEWKRYYVEHSVYNKSFNSTNVSKVKAQESKGKDDVVMALAKALTDNNVDILKDPVLQTNALLAEILIVAQAIMNQNNKVGGTMSLADTISGLSLGITTNT